MLTLFRRYSGLKHHSTARKIINLVVGEIEHDLLKDPRLASLIKEADSASGFGSCSVAISTKNTYRLMLTMGDVLKEEIPEKLYEVYQGLSAKTKKDLRLILGRAYYRQVRSSTKDLAAIDYSVERERDHYAEHLTATIILPEHFKNPIVLQNLLTDALSLVRSELLSLRSEEKLSCMNEL